MEPKEIRAEGREGGMRQKVLNRKEEAEVQRPRKEKGASIRESICERAPIRDLFGLGKGLKNGCAVHISTNLW